MPSESRKKPLTKPMGRSRVTNGSKLSSHLDGRSVWARRLRDLIQLYSNDLGGAEALSTAQGSLVRRAAVLTVELERAEEGFAQVGEAQPGALSAYQTTSSALRRILETLGLQKFSPKDEKEIAKRLDGIRVTKEFRDNMSVADLGVCVGNDKARLEFARRLHFAMAQAVATGEPMPPALAKMAVELALAGYAPEELESAAPVLDMEAADAALL